MRLIDADAIKIPKGFFEKVDSVPKFYDWLDAQPTIVPSAEKTGRWQYVDYGGFGNYHCTACGKICICNGDYDYCPNCGSRMVNNNE